MRAFHALDDRRSRASMAALDAINAKFGRGTVAYAATGTKKGWKLRSNFVSSCYTSGWHELPCIVASNPEQSPTLELMKSFTQLEGARL